MSTALRPWEEAVDLVWRWYDCTRNLGYRYNDIVYRATQGQYTAKDYEIPPEIDPVGEYPYPRFDWPAENPEVYLVDRNVTDLRDYLFFLSAYATCPGYRDSPRSLQAQANLFIDHYNLMRRYYLGAKEPIKTEK